MTTERTYRDMCNEKGGGGFYACKVLVAVINMSKIVPSWSAETT